MNATTSWSGLVWLVWVLATLLIFLLNGTRSALIDLRFRSIRHPLESELKRWKGLIRFSKTTEKNSSPLRLLTPLCLFGNACAIGWLLAKHIPALDLLPDHLALRFLALLALLIPALGLHLFALELLPSRLAVRYPQPFLATSQVLLPFIEWFLRPILSIANLLDRGPRRFVDGNPPKEPLDYELQISALDIEDADITPVTERIVSRALTLNDLTVYDILLPRNQVQYFDLADSTRENLEIARSTGHTRFPLCEGDLDHCIGLIHIKDVFRFRGGFDRLDLRKTAREIVRFDLDLPLDKALQILLTKRVHMALAEDEFGGVTGIITLERILEELVGDIQDEFDREERMITRLKKDLYRASGLAPIHELEEMLDISIVSEDASTLGGLIVSELGRIPEKDEQIRVGRLSITIQDSDDKRVISTTLSLLPPLDPESELA